MALTRKFFGATASEGAAFAFGYAASPVLAPAVESLRQAAWALHAVRVPEALDLAAGVATGKVDRKTADGWAKAHGFEKAQWQALIDMATEAPDIGLAMRAWRRDKLKPNTFETVLKRHGLDETWNAAIEALKDEILTPGELAAAIHRGLVPAEGLVLGEQPAAPFKVDAYPVLDIDAIKEAAGSGYDEKRLHTLVGLQGLPMGPHEAAQALFRGIITHGDYIRAFNTSNMRNEWAQAILDQSRQIPTARDFFENALRGYHDLAWAQGQAQRHGMSEADSLVIYQNQGRPMNLHQITTGLARGGKFKPEPGEITDPYEAAIVEGNLKPAYYDLAKANRYTLPSTFAIRALAQSGVWTEAKTAQRLKESGWLPADADEVAKAWSTSGGATADPHVAKAQTQLWTATHASYLNREASATVARTKLQQAGVATTAIAQILGIWDHERELIRKGLSPANVKKAFAKGSRNNATGQPWTRDEAIAFLVGLGWSANEANDYLDIP